MSTPRDRILVVEHDPVVSDLLARQTLQASGYQVLVVADASTAAPQIMHFSPDVLIIDMNLPGLSGKDLMVALAAQGITIPVIALSARHVEGEILQAFRLGATDFLFLPVREAEVIATVERVLKQVRERREREQLAQKLQQTNQELQNRVRELTTIFAVGKAVISITDQRALFDKLVEGAVRVTQADLGWFLLRDAGRKNFTLAAQRGLPASLLPAAPNQPWDDGVSSLVAMSGEALSIYGEPFKRFKISSLGQAALIVPVRAQKQVVALLVTMRKALKPFTASEQTLLEAVSDYASISLVNASLFRALEDRARSLQTAVENGATHERINAELLKNAGQELRAPLESIAATAEGLLAGKFGRTNSDQRRLLETVQEQLAQLQRVADALSAPLTNGAGKMPASVNLSEVARQAAGLMQPYAQRAGQSLLCELTPEPLVAPGDAYQVLSIITGLLSNAIKHSPRGGQVTLRVSRAQEGKDPASARVSISDSGPGIEARHQPSLFERGYRAGAAPASGFGGLGISLALIKELVEGLGGKIWVESQPGQGASFHFSLPAIK